MTRMTVTASLAENLLGTGVVSTTPVAGGDICVATRLRLTDGTNALIKTRPNAPARFFAIEAAGLEQLRTAGGAPVPEVLGVNEECLILSWIEPGKPQPETAESFGRALSATHAAGAPTFGAEKDGFIGLAPLPNGPKDTWEEFFAVRRVLPYLKAAQDRGHLTSDQAATIEKTIRRLPELSGPAETPALLHGDLWSGNLVWGMDQQVWLVDPAVHGGHRETDIAMLSLFGAPHLERIIDSYNEVTPLAEGWRDRLGLHQLHPLLVHTVLFGGAYGARATAVAQQLIAPTNS
ncbi:MAG: phosphotransferase [Actinomycetales bacterium]|nr:phosphotransferase [Actinomycetales bacterium]